MPAKQPNFLILMADQMTTGALPAYGHKVTKAPHIDALAETGIVFDSAYCNSPLCAPSRYSFMAGQLPAKIGAFDNAAEFAADIPTFAHYLRHAGYRTMLSGKMHFCGADQLHGFEERLPSDIYPADFGWTPDWERPSHRPSWYHNMSSVTEAGVCARSNQLDFDDEVVFTARHSRRLRHVCDIDRTAISERQIRNARRAYYGAISYVDDQIGLIRRTLAESALADDTVVILLADHGEMLGERGLWYKMSFFEGAARVPLIVNAPRRFAPRRVAQSTPISFTISPPIRTSAAIWRPTPWRGRRYGASATNARRAGTCRACASA